MLQVLFFLFALFMPWVLGFAVVKPLLRQRDGNLLFAWGVGYPLGWFLITCLLRIYDYFGRPFDIVEIVIIESILAVPLLFVKASPCMTYEKNTRSTHSKLIYALSATIVVLLLYRWGLTMIDLMSKPVFPWDGWWSWSAKAKIFYYSEDIPNVSLSPFYAFWEFVNDDSFAIGGSRHPYFVSLIQTYSALAWRNWDDSVVSLPWLGASIAMVLTVFGGFRYLCIPLLPALLASYMVVSLPIFDIHVSLGAYADMWVGFSLLIASLVLVMIVCFSEYRLLWLFFFFCSIIYLTKNSALVFIIPFIVIALVCLLGVRITTILFVLLVMAGCFAKDFLMVDFLKKMKLLMSSDAGKFAYNDIFTDVCREWWSNDNWHFLFIVSIGSLVLALFYRVRLIRARPSFLIIVLAAASLVTMLIIAFLTTKMSDAVFISYFNRVTLYFISLLALVPACIYLSSIRDYDKR